MYASTSVCHYKGVCTLNKKGGILFFLQYLPLGFGKIASLPLAKIWSGFRFEALNGYLVCKELSSAVWDNGHVSGFTRAMICKTCQKEIMPWAPLLNVSLVICHPESDRKNLDKTSPQNGTPFTKSPSPSRNLFWHSTHHGALANIRICKEKDVFWEKLSELSQLWCKEDRKTQT